MSVSFRYPGIITGCIKVMSAGCRHWRRIKVCTGQSGISVTMNGKAGEKQTRKKRNMSLPDECWTGI